MLASIVVMAFCVALKVPVLSRFPLEFGAVLYVTLQLIWRPLYVNTGIFSDPPFQVMTFGEALHKSPAAAVGMGAGLFGFVLVAAVSILVQATH